MNASKVSFEFSLCSRPQRQGCVNSYTHYLLLTVEDADASLVPVELNARAARGVS